MTPDGPTGVPFDDAAGGDELAALGARTLARVIDYLLVPVTLGLALGVPTADRDGDTITLPVWVTIAITAGFVVYETAMVAMRGQTVGKIVVGIRVADLRTGANPSVARALWRVLIVAAALLVLGQFFGPLVAIGIYLTAVADQSLLRGVPDRAAGTVVVRVPGTGLAAPS